MVLLVCLTGEPVNSCLHAQSLSHVQLFATPWTVAPQAPLSMKFSRQGVSSDFLLQGLFQTQGSDAGFLLCKKILYHSATRVLPVEGFEGLGFILLCACFPLLLYFFLFLVLVLLKQFFYPIYLECSYFKKR